MAVEGNSVFNSPLGRKIWNKDRAAKFSSPGSSKLASKLFEYADLSDDEDSCNYSLMPLETGLEPTVLFAKPNPPSLMKFDYNILPSIELTQPVFPSALFGSQTASSPLEIIPPVVTLRETDSLYNILQQGNVELQPKVSKPPAPSKPPGSAVIRRHKEQDANKPTACDATQDSSSSVPEVVQDEPQSKIDESNVVVTLSIHQLAATGRLDDLIKLKSENTSLLDLDVSGRSPLFHACAYGQAACVKFLLTVNDIASTRHQDLHGDCALFAACIGGCVDCVTAVISSLQTNEQLEQEQCNMSGLSAAHFCRNRTCLEVINAYGLSLNILDCDGRSPLFTACALDRLDCAEYITEFLLTSCHLKIEDIFRVDNRLDTPLHAAACNGSRNCVEFLLQHGMDPGSLNNAGLRPVDLAIRNNHDSCRKIIAQYQLHFATSSDFDSILFLATIEGHKQIKRTIDTGNMAGIYEIIKTQTEGTSQNLLPRTESLYSLSRGLSMRLQRHGSWVSYQDRNVGCTYWYNCRTGEGGWNKPNNQQDDDSIAATEQAESNDQVMKLKKSGDWLVFQINNQLLYYNEQTGESKIEQEENNDHQGVTEGDWTAYFDPQAQAWYWHNHASGESEWATAADEEVNVITDVDGLEI